MKRLGWLPVTDGDFSQRDELGRAAVEQGLAGAAAADARGRQLQAMINGLKRVLEGRRPVRRDRATRRAVSAFRLEIEANERDLEGYRQRIAAVSRRHRNGPRPGRLRRPALRRGRRRCAQRFRELFAREVELAAAGSGSETPPTTPARFSRFWHAPTRVEARLEGSSAATRAQALEQARRSCRQQIARRGREHRDLCRAVSTSSTSRRACWSARSRCETSGWCATG